MAQLVGDGKEWDGSGGKERQIGKKEGDMEVRRMDGGRDYKEEQK